MKLFAIVATLSLSVTWLNADTINVPGDFATIQEAISSSTDGDVILVQPGTYPGTINPLGKAITIRSVDPTDSKVVATTILDGNQGGPAIEIYFGEALDTVIEGFTITGGANDNGGGVSVFASDPIIRLCRFQGNVAERGGAAYLLSSSAWFDRCSFVGNQAGRGGGVYLYASALPRFDSCNFVSNFASSRGGGIASDFGTGRFDRCLIAENEAVSKGGGYWGTHAGPIIINSVVRDNISESGGAVYADDTGPLLYNSTIVRNIATRGAGGLIDGIFSQPLIRNSIVRDNGMDPVTGFSVNPVYEFSNAEGLTGGLGNIDDDPLFVDAAKNEFSLRENSPSRDAGFDGWVTSYSLRDRNAAPRIQNGVVDMGAFEFTGSVPPVPEIGPLVVGLKDDGNLAFGQPLPLTSYDPETDTWTQLVRHLPAFGVAADSQARCYWVHNGETGILTRVPFDTLQPEEIGIIKKDSSVAISVSGLAVHDGILWATTGPFGIQGLYTIDTRTARATLVTTIDGIYDVWDLEYDVVNDRMLFLSSAGSLPNDPLGVYELDMETFTVTQVQPWINDNPTNEAPALQGLAFGDGKYFLLRSLYNDLEVYDANSQNLVVELSIPGSVPGSSWVLGGLSWTELDGGFPIVSDNVKVDRSGRDWAAERQ